MITPIWNAQTIPEINYQTTNKHYYTQKRGGVGGDKRGFPSNSHPAHGTFPSIRSRHAWRAQLLMTSQCTFHVTPSTIDIANPLLKWTAMTCTTKTLPTCETCLLCNASLTSHHLYHRFHPKQWGKWEKIGALVIDGFSPGLLIIYIHLFAFYSISSPGLIQCSPGLTQCSLGLIQCSLDLMQCSPGLM